MRLISYLAAKNEIMHHYYADGKKETAKTAATDDVIGALKYNVGCKSNTRDDGLNNTGTMRSFDGEGVFTRNVLVKYS